MRKAISGGLIWTGLVAAFAATAYYIYFMWGLDWGQIFTRGYGFMLVMTMFGSVIIFVVLWGIFGFLASVIDS